MSGPSGLVGVALGLGLCCGLLCCGLFCRGSGLGRRGSTLGAGLPVELRPGRLALVGVLDGGAAVVSIGVVHLPAHVLTVLGGPDHTLRSRIDRADATGTTHAQEGEHAPTPLPEW